MNRLPSRDFWSRQRVLLTGHTGFKGSWMSLWLEKLGADVRGFALAPDQSPALYDQLQPFAQHVSQLGDVRDPVRLQAATADFQPTTVIHMAAQPLVRQSYRDPVGTFETNVTGTVNLLEGLRGCDTLKSIVVVTTDKVYANDGGGDAFSEADRLGGHDPYSASKAAAELITQSYAQSFLSADGIAVATARAGNVIGGGDWSPDRIIPDIWRALQSRTPLRLRYPNATRPWQHVLDPISGYLLLAEDLSAGRSMPPSLNFGPLGNDAPLTVAEIATLVGAELGLQNAWELDAGDHPAEMPVLGLDARLAQQTLDWSPRLSAHDALLWTAQWYRRFDKGEDMRAASIDQLNRYEAL